MSNKKTYMLINAWNLAGESDRAELLRWIEAEDFVRKEKVEAVTAIYNRLGIDRLAEKKISEYFDESRQYLSRVGVDESRKAVLLDYAMAMMNRRK